MDTNGDESADISEFVAFMETVLDGVPDKAIDKRICSLLESRVSGRFSYDFSGMYCGYRGVSAIIEALAADITFEAVDLSGCGVNNTGVKQLAELLKTHPVRPSAIKQRGMHRPHSDIQVPTSQAEISTQYAAQSLAGLVIGSLVARTGARMQAVRRVRLSNNPISAEGIAALAAMLEANPNIVEVDVSGNHCERNFSPVHSHPAGSADPALEPSPTTLAQTALQKSLTFNQVS